VLKLHHTSHFGEKVYKCTICSDTFTSKKMMEIHIKSHAEPGSVDAGVNVAGVAAEVTESCASSSSDKENKAESDSEHRTIAAAPAAPPSPPLLPQPAAFAGHYYESSHEEQQRRNLCYFLYQRERVPQPATAQLPPPPPPPVYLSPTPTSTPPNGVNPALLAAAAAAAEREARAAAYELDDDAAATAPQPPQAHRQYLETPASAAVPVSAALPVTEPNVCVVPESLQRRLSPYSFVAPPPPPTEYLDGCERLSSEGSPEGSPSTPSPSSSPDPMDLAVARDVLSLPPRKRSKMILKSMESAAAELSPVRHSSVIQFARAPLAK